METGRQLKTKKQSRKRIVIGWRWLLALLLLGTVVGGLFGWRYIGQKGNVAGYYLGTAEEAYQDEDWQVASDAYYQYHRFRPDDLDARIKLALAYGKIPDAQRNQKVRRYRETMALVPKPIDSTDEDAPYREEYRELKSSLLDALVKSRRYSDIRKEAGDDAFGFDQLPEVKRAVAWSEFVTAKMNDRPVDSPIRDPERPGEIVHDGKSPLQLVREYLVIDPGDIEMTRFASFGLREIASASSDTGQQAEADAVIDRMLAADGNKEKARAWLSVFGYRRAHRLPGDQEALQQAIEVYSDPEDALALGNAAMRVARGTTPIDPSWLEQAIEMYKLAVAHRPEASSPVLRLSEAYFDAGDFEQATAALNESIENMSAADAIQFRMYLANLYLLQEDVEKCQEQIDVLDQVIASAEQNSRLFSSQRRRLEFESRVELFKAKVYLLAREYSKARRIAFSLVGQNRSIPASDDDDGGRVIASLGSGSSTEKQLLFDAWMLIGRTSQSLGRWAEAADAFESAAELGVDSGEAAGSAANAYRQIGQADSALRVVERQRQLGREPLLFEVAALQFSEEIKKPTADRDWSAFNSTIRAARQTKIDPWQANLMVAARMQLEGAPREKILEEIDAGVQQNPEAPNLFSRLVLFYQQLGEFSLADEALSRYSELASDPWRVDLLNAQLQMIRGNYEQAIPLLDGMLSDVGQDQKRLCLKLKARAQVALGRMEFARKTLQQLADQDDLDSLVRLAEMEVRLKNFTELEKHIERMKEVEGSEGVYWKYFVASRAIADDPSPQDVLDAERLQAQVVEANPNWPLAYSLHGRILTEKQNYAGAAKALEIAVQKGDRRLQVYQELLSALFAAGEYEKSEQYLEEMQSQGSNAASFLGAAVDVAESQSQMPELLRRAKAVVEKTPANAVARIWYAQLLLMNGQEDQAKAQLTDAFQDSPSDIGAGTALFLFYLKRDQAEAENVLQLIEANGKDPLSKQRAIVLATGWRRLRQDQRAEGFLRQAIAGDPNDVNLKLMLGETLLAFDRDAAEEYLREFLRTDRNPMARRLLALTLMTKGGPDAWAEVQTLLKGRESVTQDLRVLALLSMRRGGLDNLLQARDLINQAIEQTGVTTSGDRMLLSVTFESEGNLDEAERLIDELVSSGGGNVESLAAKFDFQMRNHQYDAAEATLKKLEVAAEDAQLTGKLVFLKSQVEYLRLNEDQQKIRDVIVQFGSEQEPAIDEEQVGQRSQLYINLGQMFASSRLYEDAENWYRKLFELDDQQVKPLTVTLARRDNHQQAIELLQIDCSKPESLSAQDFVSLIEVMSAGNPSDEVWSQTQPVWDFVDASDDWVLNMIGCFANVAKGDEDQAIQKLSRIVKDNPDNAMLLNNLASLIGHLPARAEEALTNINQAIQLSGEQPYLLDTKSSILVELGKPEEAIKLLKPLNSLRRPDPRVLFRLAVAQAKNNALDEARLSYARAVALGLHAEVLTNYDKKLVADLETAFNR